MTRHADTTGHLFGRAAADYLTALEKAVSAHGLTPGQFFVLRALVSAGTHPQRVFELARHVPVLQPAVTKALAHFALDGLAQRSQGPERYPAYLATEAGASRLQAIEQTLAVLHAQLFEDWPLREVAAFGAACSRLSQAARR